MTPVQQQQQQQQKKWKKQNTQKRTHKTTNLQAKMKYIIKMSQHTNDLNCIIFKIQLFGDIFVRNK